jgi:glycosyltransferase involved in cell wall biosynthesis
MEGGANVVCEALAARTPVIASRVPGNVGMLGRGYAGYYPVGDERALARLLWRAESDTAFYAGLRESCNARRALVTPRHEQAALRALIADLG